MTVRKRRVEGKCDAAGQGGSVRYTVQRKCGGGAAVGDGWESVHRTTLATLDEQNRCQVGPTILFDRPPAQDPRPSSLRFPCGDARAVRDDIAPVRSTAV
jgi:hypothetical protein